MFYFLDKWIEKKMESRIKKRCLNIIENEITVFLKNYPNEKAASQELLNKIITEVNRLYPMAEESILWERIVRARLTFWSAFLIGPLLVGMLNGFPSPPLPFFTPMISAFLYWVISLGLTPLAFEQRIKGGAKSIRVNFEKTFDECKKTLTHPSAILQFQKIIHENIENNEKVEETKISVEAKTNTPPIKLEYKLCLIDTPPMENRDAENLKPHTPPPLVSMQNRV